MKLNDILREVPYIKADGDLNIDIQGLHYDSRKVTPNSVFFCIEGFKVDGHEFAGSAVSKGASVVVLRRDIPLPYDVTKVFVEDVRHSMALFASAFYGHPSDELTLIGVTGTNGKTTITYMIKSILEKSGEAVGVIGTITNMIGKDVLPSEHTTPESVDLQALLKEMENRGVGKVAMEVSSHSLSLDRVIGCNFDVGIFTNLTQDHLDFHGTLENYLKAKAKLFDLSKTGVINIDDKSGQIILEGIKGKSITYGIDNHADVMAENINITAKGSEFDLCILNKDKVHISLNIPGDFSVYNALASAAACHAVGVSTQDIKDGLENLQGVPGRFELLNINTPYSVIVDYAHTPDGLKNILETARNITEGRLITLFGCGGDRDAKKRPIMGEMAGKFSDLCIVTSDNPRTEEPMAIIKDILPGIDRTGCPYVVIENRREAISYALKHAQPGDVVILAGKGHETYQILKDRTIHFDEKEIVSELLGRDTE